MVGNKIFTKKNRIKIERKTDVSTIEHGLGFQLYNFVDYVLNQSSANSEYKDFKRLNYLHLSEILEIIKRLK